MKSHMGNTIVLCEYPGTEFPARKIFRVPAYLERRNRRMRRVAQRAARQAMQRENLCQKVAEEERHQLLHVSSIEPDQNTDNKFVFFFVWKFVFEESKYPSDNSYQRCPIFRHTTELPCKRWEMDEISRVVATNWLDTM